MPASNSGAWEAKEGRLLQVWSQSGIKGRMLYQKNRNQQNSQMYHILQEFQCVLNESLLQFLQIHQKPQEVTHAICSMSQISIECCKFESSSSIPSTFDFLDLTLCDSSSSLPWQKCCTFWISAAQSELEENRKQNKKCKCPLPSTERPNSSPSDVLTKKDTKPRNVEDKVIRGLGWWGTHETKKMGYSRLFEINYPYLLSAYRISFYKYLLESLYVPLTEFVYTCTKEHRHGSPLPWPR